MKLNTLLGSILILLLPLGSIAQDFFEGEINYDIELNSAYAQQLKNLMPSAYQYVIKENKMKFMMKGGMMEAMLGEFLIDMKENQSFMVKHSEKKAYIIEADANTQADVKPQVEKLEETINLLGYTCQKYKVTMQTQGMNMTQYVWATDKIKVPQPSELSSAVQNNGKLLIAGLDGFPLKLETQLPGGAGTMIMTANQVEKREVKDEEISVPDDYKREVFDPSSLMRN